LIEQSEIEKAVKVCCTIAQILKDQGKIEESAVYEKEAKELQNE